MLLQTMNITARIRMWGLYYKSNKSAKAATNSCHLPSVYNAQMTQTQSDENYLAVYWLGIAGAIDTTPTTNMEVVLDICVMETMRQR